jgi:putative FmdB family regulatory protein
MPFYEYECSKCRYYVEVLQKISDPPLKKCPSCGKSALRKLVSAPVFRLKGSGWYETDFKSDQERRRNLAGADKDAPAATADSKDGGTDAGKAAKDGTGEAAKSTAAEGSANSAKASAGETVAAASPRRSAPARRGAAKAKSNPKRASARPAPRKSGKPKRRGGR